MHVSTELQKLTELKRKTENSTCVVEYIPFF